MAATKGQAMTALPNDALTGKDALAAAKQECTALRAALASSADKGAEK